MEEIDRAVGRAGSTENTGITEEVEVGRPPGIGCIKLGTTQKRAIATPGVVPHQKPKGKPQYSQ